MRILVFSDLHLCDKTGDIVFGEVFPGLEKSLLENNIKVLVCLGDFYHVRHKIDVLLQNKVVSWFKKLFNYGIFVHILPGNHDQVNVLGDNSLEIFNELKGNTSITVYKNPIANQYGAWLPYRKDVDELIPIIKDNIKINSHNVFFMHNGVKNFMMNNNIMDNIGVDPSLFGVATVLCGHYHKRQQINNIYYIGSPYQIDAGEVFEDKGYVIFDYVSRIVNYVSTNWGRHFYKIDNVPFGACIDDASIKGIKRGDVLKITPPNGVNLELYKSSLSIPEGVECVIDLYKEKDFSRLVVEDSSFGSYVNAYVNKFGEELDKNLLFQVFSDIKDN